MADDEEMMHEAMHKMLNDVPIEISDIVDFYSTDELTDYLTDYPDEENRILLLDHFFHGGTDGLDALPYIRNICPDLPILMLTTHDDFARFSEAVKKYDIGFLHKPVSPVDLPIHLESVIDKMEKMKILQGKVEDLLANLEDNNDYLNLIEEDNEKMKQAMEQAEIDSLAMVKLVEEQEEAMLKYVPMNILETLEAIFPNVTFWKTCLDPILHAPERMKEWKRMSKLLKTIDWNDDTRLPAGIKIQMYKGAENVWEYRFSQAARIFVFRKSGTKPVIMLIDPIHSYPRYMPYIKKLAHKWTHDEIK